MKKKLFLAAFKKAEKQSGNNTKHGLSTHLEKVFIDDLKFSVNKITFVRYYEKYIKDDNSINNNPSSDLLNKISEYIGYINYEEFLIRNKEESIITFSNSDNDIKKPNVLNVFIKNYKATIIVSSLLFIGFVIYYSLNKQHWMVWDEDHYVEVKFDSEKYNIGQLKLYNEERINHFRRITPDCDTHFFDSNGEVEIWYGKNNKKELECFTALGLHPKTGKTLDPITVYMIRKYVCPNYGR